MAFSLAPVSAPAPVSGWLARNRETSEPWRSCTVKTASWGQAVRDDPARGVLSWECRDRGMTVGGGDSGVVSYFVLERRASGSPYWSFRARTSAIPGRTPLVGIGWCFLLGPFAPGKPEHTPCRACVTPGVHTSLHFLFISFGERVPRAGHTFIQTGPGGARVCFKVSPDSGPKYLLEG